MDRRLFLNTAAAAVATGAIITTLQGATLRDEFLYLCKWDAYALYHIARHRRDRAGKAAAFRDWWDRMSASERGVELSRMRRCFPNARRRFAEAHGHSG